MAIKRMTKADHPQSLGAFKPVGHVVVAMPDDTSAAQAAQALRQQGFDADDILAYTAAGYDWLREHLGADVVARYFAPLSVKKVERFKAPNLLGLNFVLYDALAGGASRSPRIDTQGKTLALALLQMPIDVADLEAMRRPMPKEPS